MNRRVFSVILLPTSDCNVACEYCFERKDKHRLSTNLLPLLTSRLLDHLENEGIMECEVYWQGGEAMMMGPEWFVAAGRLMERAAAKRGRRFIHYLQTNLISYSESWNDVLRTMFQGSLGTSMDFPNDHRKLFNGSAEAYTRLWTRKLRAAQAAGIKVGVIAVLHQGSLEAGPEKFYQYFTEELGLTDFQVKHHFRVVPPVSGGCFSSRPASWRFPGKLVRHLGSAVSRRSVAWPFDALIDHFTGGRRDCRASGRELLNQLSRLIPKGR